MGITELNLGEECIDILVLDEIPCSEEDSPILISRGFCPEITFYYVMSAGSRFQDTFQ